MVNMKGIRGEMTRAVRREHTALISINLHTESNHNGVPVKWLLDNLDGQRATILAPAGSEKLVPWTLQYKALNELGTIHYTTVKGLTRDQYIGVAAGYLLKRNDHTKKHRLNTVRELLLNQACQKPEYVRDSAPKTDYTREELNPWAENGYYMIYSDLQYFRTALQHWLSEIAPKLYVKAVRSTEEP